MGRQGARNRLATGIYRDKTGVAVVVVSLPGRDKGGGTEAHRAGRGVAVLGM